MTVALVVACAVAALDIALGERSLLVELLMGGLLIGALVLSVGIARHRAGGERQSALLSAQYGVASTLAEADSLEEAAPDLLAAIGAPLDWDVGHLWEVPVEGPLRRVATWTAPGVDVPGFEEATRRLRIEPGVGLPGRVWRTGKPAWLADVIAEGNNPRAEAAGRAGLRAGLAFPVLVGHECAGVIEFFARGVREPEPDLIALADALGVTIGEFVEGVQATDALRESNARMRSMFASALDGVITIDHEGHVLSFNAAAERIFGYRAEEALGTELAELVVPPGLRARHRAALRRNVETGEAILLGQRVELTGMRADGSEFPVELAISRIDTEPPMFTGTVRDITERRKAEQEREELLRLERLARRDATQARDQLEAILSGVADAVTAQAPDGRLLFANGAALELMGFESSEELLAAPPERLRHRFEILDEEGRPFPVERYPGRRALAGEGDCEAVMRLRMYDTGEEIWTNVKATAIHDEDGEVVMAINVTEDITHHVRAERSQRFLSEASALLVASLDVEELLGQVAQLAVPEVADRVVIDLVRDEGHLERVATAGSERPEHQSSGNPVPRSTIVVPLSARGKRLGRLTFATDASGRRFDEDDRDLAEELARRCATAIDNARLFSERAYIARTLQESLLPAELPDVPGIETAARFRPTGQGNEVGGDFYDLFETGGRGWTVVVGDVCGKGPDAAAVTALARYTLRAAAMRERLPSRSLRLLNEALLRQRDDRRFCTVAYGYLEPNDRGAQLHFASGGHPLPLLLRADGAVEAVGEPGTLLGVLPDPEIEDRSVMLAPGDALVFYTDGVTEGRGAQSKLDEELLAELLRGCVGASADAIAARIEAAAVAAHDGSPRDDIALLVLRVAD